MSRRIAALTLGVLLLAGCSHHRTPEPVPTTTAPSPTTRPTTTAPTARPTSQPTTRTPTTAPSSLATQRLGGFACRDGSVSHAAHRQGACSHHGGVA